MSASFISASRINVIVVRMYEMHEPLKSPKPFPGTFLPENLENFHTHTQHYAVCARRTSKASNSVIARLSLRHFSFRQISWKPWLDQVVNMRVVFSTFTFWLFFVKVYLVLQGQLRKWAKQKYIPSVVVPSVFYFFPVTGIYLQCCWYFLIL